MTGDGIFQTDAKAPQVRTVNADELRSDLRSAASSTLSKSTMITLDGVALSHLRQENSLSATSLLRFASDHYEMAIKTNHTLERSFGQLVYERYRKGQMCNITFSPYVEAIASALGTKLYHTFDGISMVAVTLTFTRKERRD